MRLFKNKDETLAIEELLIDRQFKVALVRFVYDAWEETDWDDEAGIGVALDSPTGTNLVVRATGGHFKDTELLDLFKAWVDVRVKGSV